MARAGEEEAETAKLKTAVLEAPAHILTQSDLHLEREFMPVDLSDGAVLPAGRARLDEKSPEATIAVGSTAFTLALDKGKLVLKNAAKGGKRDLPLKLKRGAYEPAKVLLGETKYALAFPTVALGRGRGAGAAVTYRAGCTQGARIGGTAFSSTTTTWMASTI